MTDNPTLWTWAHPQARHSRSLHPYEYAEKLERAVNGLLDSEKRLNPGYANDRVTIGLQRVAAADRDVFAAPILSDLALALRRLAERANTFAASLETIEVLGYRVRVAEHRADEPVRSETRSDRQERLDREAGERFAKQREVQP